MTGPAAGTAWGELTSPEAGAVARVLLLPLGSTEQHGPHLPLDTDTRIAVAIAGGAAARASARGLEVAVAPALAYGASGEHQGFAGTLSIGQEALALVVTELARSVGPEVAHVVVVNGHGGNVEALDRAVTTLRYEGRPVTVWSPRFDTGEGRDTHAGLAETSMLLALGPEVVRLDRAEPGVTEPLRDLLPALRDGGLAAVTANGVLGDPTGASAERGRALLDRAIADLVALIGDLADPAARTTNATATTTDTATDTDPATTEVPTR